MKIDSGLELELEEIRISNHLFANMELIEKDMRRKILESSKKSGKHCICFGT